MAEWDIGDKVRTPFSDEVLTITDRRDHNFNKGNEQGAQLLERSFRECGAGRSVLIDKDNRLVGGIRAPFTQGAAYAGVAV